MGLIGDIKKLTTWKVQAHQSSLKKRDIRTFQESVYF